MWRHTASPRSVAFASSMAGRPIAAGSGCLQACRGSVCCRLAAPLQKEAAAHAGTVCGGQVLLSRTGVLLVGQHVRPTGQTHAWPRPLPHTAAATQQQHRLGLDSRSTWGRDGSCSGGPCSVCWGAISPPQTPCLRQLGTPAILQDPPLQPLRPGCVVRRSGPLVVLCSTAAHSIVAAASLLC